MFLFETVNSGYAAAEHSCHLSRQLPALTCQFVIVLSVALLHYVFSFVRSHKGRVGHKITGQEAIDSTDIICLMINVTKHVCMPGQIRWDCCESGAK